MRDVSAERLQLLRTVDVGELLGPSEQHGNEGETEQKQQASPAEFRRRPPASADEESADAKHAEGDEQRLGAVVENPRQPLVQRVGNDPLVGVGIEPEPLDVHVRIGTKQPLHCVRR